MRLPFTTQTYDDLPPLQASNRTRLDFLDGLRGLAAFYVMLSHTYALGAYDNDIISSSLSPMFVWATRGLNFAHYAVAVFIVLSGFCLMLPIARSQDRNMPGGLWGFVRRRARRILPPYYVALTFVIIILFVTHHFIKHSQASSADISTGDIIAHYLLLHNLFAKYNLQIDGPMWSVAWEWQIYFLFALILLPVWRRFGIIWTVLLGFALGFLPMLLPGPSNFAWTCPWYIGLFAFGMTAAVVANSKNDQYRMLKNSLFINSTLTSIAVGFLLLVYLRIEWLYKFNWLFDIFIGGFTALFILACAHTPNAYGLKTIKRGLESRYMMTLGAFSYSLYLIQQPILQKITDILHQHHCSHYFQLACLFFIGIPFCLIAAYLFHLAFERPFMPGRPKTERQAEIAAIVSPAP